MHRLRLAALLSSGCLALGASTAAASADPTPATISVVGHATVTRPPDIAIITAEIVSSDPDTSKASAANDAIADRVASALTQLHVDQAHSVGFRSGYVPPPANPTSDPHERSGYVVTRTIEVQVPTSRVDQTVHVLNDNGVDSIDDVRTDIRDRDEIYHTLFIQALADAESQAHIIATAARVKIVRLRAVDASTLAPALPGISFAEARMSRIPVQNTQISASLSATYEVEPFPLPGYMRKIPNPPAGRGAH